MYSKLGPLEPKKCELINCNIHVAIYTFQKKKLLFTKKGGGRNGVVAP